jgi:hypothetical protein
MRLPRFAAVIPVTAFLVAPTAASGYTYDPPAWFKDGIAVIKARGGTCHSENSTRHAPDPTGGPGETTVYTGEYCTHPIPRALAKELLGGVGNPNVHPAEVCAAHASEVTGSPGPYTPTEENYLYTCSIFFKPGTDSKPNRASWRCLRSTYGGQGGSHNDRRWISKRTKRYRTQTFRTLRQCLNRRLRKKL